MGNGIYTAQDNRICAMREVKCTATRLISQLWLLPFPKRATTSANANKGLTDPGREVTHERMPPTPLCAT